MNKLLIDTSIQLESLSFKVSTDNQSTNIKKPGDIAAEIRSKVMQQNNDRKSSEYDDKMMAKITAKLKSGKKLTSKEAHFLQKYNPQLYQQYLRIQQMAKAVENQLKHAQTKQEVNDIILHAFGCVSDKDPYKEYVIAAIDRVIKDFQNSDAYEKLPDTNEEAQKNQKSRKPNDPEENDDFAEDSFDPMEWSPLQDVIDSMPTFDSPA